MHIIMVTGFLGSGKTTFILQVLRHLANYEKKFALIVNEVGQPGIDNKLFRRLGVDVRELLGGCICCTSASGFRHAINELRHDSPDFVLVEPSGVADPAIVHESLCECLKEADSLTTIALLDSDRIDIILEATGSLAASAVSMAQSVIITKTDIASVDGVSTAESFARNTNPAVSIFKAPFPEHLHEIRIKEVLGWKN